MGNGPWKVEGGSPQRWPHQPGSCWPDTPEYRRVSVRALAEIHLAADDPGAVARAAACFTIADEAPPPPALVIERVD